MEDTLFDFYSLFINESLVEDLYAETLLTPLTTSTIVVTLLCTVTFYYIINSIRFGQLKHWLIMMAIGAFLTFSIVFLSCYNMVQQEIPRNEANIKKGIADYRFDQGSSVFFTYGLTMFFLAMILFVVFSLLIKHWSTNSRKTPF
ncbi:hypothetical protein [Emticicia sp. C21]|uniref:hypothetical protein n=1 Tax=Emticicia sp. C21 TaxID=2302915 RepID=UPI000E3484F5|nr:hypothetical protein [Emticicia sp. C21]RFS14950.1 hypothetical protein D0T08_17845 [Emticicia sp. C21]